MKATKGYGLGNLVCAASMGVCTLVLSANLAGTAFWFLVALVSFAIALLYAFKKSFVQTVLCRLTVSQALVAGILCLCIFSMYYDACDGAIWELMKWLHMEGNSALSTVVRALFLFSIYCLFCIVVTRAQSALTGFYSGMSGAEKRFLLLGSAVWIVALYFVYKKTTIFYSDYCGNVYFWSDAIYNLDSAICYRFDLYASLVGPENDIRQLLFGLFSVPFGAVAKTFGRLVFMNRYFFYAAGLASLQAIAIHITAILLGRMALDDENAKLRPLFWVLFMGSFSTILFSLCLEQYVFPVFWAVLLIYQYVNKRPGRDMLYIVATGTIITSGILFPLIDDYRRPKQACRAIAKTFLKYCAFLLMFGYTGYVVFDAVPSLTSWLSVAETSTISSRVLHFIRFSSTVLLYPASRIMEATSKLGEPYLFYEMTPTTGVSVAGAIILLLVIAGFILNRKSTYARICFGWVLLSAFVIIGVGWGVWQNATIVYSYYFGWAYISLAFMGIAHLLKKRPTWLIVVLGLAIAAIVVVNLSGVIDILDFSFRYYAPVAG